MITTVKCALIALSVGLASTLLGSADAQTADVRAADPSVASPPARLDDLRSLVGDWRANDAEAGFSAQAGGAIVGHLYLFDGASPRLYEIWIFREEGGTVLLRQKHYAADLKSWEQGASWSERRLVALGPGRIYLDNLTLAKDGDTMDLIIRVPDKTGGASIHVNHFARVR